MSASILPPLLALAAAVGGLFMMALNLRRARTIEDTPAAKIRSAPQGYLSLGGLACSADGELLRAPLTGVPCLWYRYTIERYSRREKSSGWDTIESGSSEQFFALDDRTDRCHIDPRGADVTTGVRQRWKGSERRPGYPSVGWQLFAGEYRYTEYRIHADEWVYVLGWYETVHAPSTEARAGARTKALLNEWKQDRDALLARFDRNRNGEIDLHEWERARREAAQLAQQQVLAETAPAPINIVARPPLRDKPYLISSRDPRALAAHYRRTAMLSLAIGFGIAAAVVWNFYRFY